MQSRSHRCLLVSVLVVAQPYLLATSATCYGHIVFNSVIYVLIYFLVLVLVFQLFFSFSFVLVLQYFFVLVLVLTVICLSVSHILHQHRISNLLTKTC